MKNNLEEIIGCVDCQNGELVLGKSTHNFGVTNVFYTISPDPEMNNFNEKLPDNQYKYIINRFKIAYSELQKHLKTLGYTIHFEFNKSNNLHIHGLIYIDSIYSGYNKNIVLMSKVFNRHFGRQFLKSNISSRFEWIKDHESVYKYVNKSNDYPPIHKITRNKTLDEEFLIKDEISEEYYTETIEC